MDEVKKTVHSFNSHDLPIESVTVYNDRADITKQLKVRLESGLHEIVIKVFSLIFLTLSSFMN